MTRIPLIGLVAHGSGRGKTRLTLALLDEFARRGLRVAVLKHGQHIALPEGKDSSLYMKHGAEASLVVSPTGWLLAVVPPQEPDFAAARELLTRSCQADLLLAEGYKNGPQPKLLLTEQRIGAELLLPNTLALVSEAAQHLPLPCFSPDDEAGIADFIMRYCGMEGK